MKSIVCAARVFSFNTLLLIALLTITEARAGSEDFSNIFYEGGIFSVISDPCFPSYPLWMGPYYGSTPVDAARNFVEQFRPAGTFISSFSYVGFIFPHHRYSSTIQSTSNTCDSHMQIQTTERNCASSLLFNPYQRTCQTFCTIPGDTWLPPLGNCGPEEPIIIENPCPNCGCPLVTDPEYESRKLGNPCNPATGNKYQTERDYADKNGTLSVTRSYNSDFTTDLGFGQGWTAGILKSLGINSDEVFVRRGSGRYETFNNTGGQWNGPVFTRFSLTETGTGFVITKNKGDTETYTPLGQIVSETSADGQTTTYTYNGSDQLESITSHFGQSINLTWNATDHIETITDPFGGVYTYSYDAANNLTGVTYPDSTSRTYHYENIDFPNHLTGITDENGVRYSTFAYDEQGRAISTEHADIGGGGAQEKFEIDFGQ